MRKLMLICVVLALGTSTVLAEGKGKEKCNNETLKGGYGVLLSGDIFGDQVIGVVDVTFNGDGTFHQTSNIHRASGLILTDVPTDGTYFVNEDCTGEYTHPVQGGSVTAKFVIVDNGKEYRLVVMTPNNRISGNGRRK